ncbi:pentatricopeptide repeat-containing protein At4g14170-like [Andrographis paniculata]|uniref:pentatricopeptide repeat-containing protein At4g14170-like n=1 Tax=Andrographis paniculata TaxID=175694 RepID=UPI0021E88FD8|nr:pentatricopeptide repeat-containing protein At4g14170-like [Andrographis paniculata]
MFNHGPFRRAAGIRLHSLASVRAPQPPPVPNILHLCSAAPSLSAAQKAHAVAITHGLLPSSVSIAAALILSYASHHSSLSILLSVFNQSVRHSRSPFLHNTLIRACALLSNDLGISVYNDMLRRMCLLPDDYTFPFVLKLCADCSYFPKGLEVHGRLIKAGFDVDLYVNNTLLLFYGDCGDLGSVRKVFDEMPERDLITWNTCIRVFSDNECPKESITLFRDMIFLSEFMPNAVTIVSILPVCVALEAGDFVGLIHCYVFKVGFDDEIRVGNALIDAYGKCRNRKAMAQVFDEMIDKNDVSWNSMIGALSCNGFFREAYRCFTTMVRDGMKANTVTLATVLPSLLDLNKGRELHGYSVRTGLDSDIFVANALVDMYGKWGRHVQALNIFDAMETRNIVSWNTMIGCSAQNGLESVAFRRIREMQARGTSPNSVTITNILPACARLGSLQHGREIHARSMKLTLASDLFVSNALIDMYAKCGRLDLARTIFDGSPRDEVSYNTLIMGYAQTIECLNSITLFTEMAALGLNLDAVSYMGALSACANINAVKEGRQIHAYALRRLFHKHLFVANSLLDFYAKCGRVDVATKVFAQIQNKDTASWNTMILGYGMLGEASAAIELFESMKKDSIEPDSVSYIAVLSACSHGGLVEKGKTYFEEMLARSIEPSEMHYACVVDLLGRSGHLQEAVLIITSIPGEPGANVWGALLGASQVHGNIELGCWAAERLLELKPGQPGYYVLLSNMYADAGRWGEVDRVRKLMNQRQVKKNPGCSWLQVSDEVHSFVAGERFDPRLWNVGAG